MLEWLTLLGLAGYAEVLQTHGYDNLEYMVSDTVRPSVCPFVCPSLSVCLSVCLSVAREKACLMLRTLWKCGWLTQRRRGVWVWV